MSKVRGICLGFDYDTKRLAYPIHSRHFFMQSEVKSTPIMTRSHEFFRALRRPRVSALSFDWFTGMYAFFVIGHSGYFGFWYYDTHLKTAQIMQVLFLFLSLKRIRFTVIWSPPSLSSWKFTGYETLICRQFLPQITTSICIWVQPRRYCV